MDHMEEKLATFTTVVLQQAARESENILQGAQQKRKASIDSMELSYLEDAHQRIQNAIRKMGKASDEEISRTIVESKQALFTRREEIIDAIMNNVKSRLVQFRTEDQYLSFLTELLRDGFSALGEGKFIVMVDTEDTAAIAEALRQLGREAEIVVPDEILSGGCMLVNQTTGRMVDHSLERSIRIERQQFLTRYRLSIDG